MCEGHGPQNGKYLHRWGKIDIDGIRADPVVSCGLRDKTHKVGLNEGVKDLSGGDCDIDWLCDVCGYVMSPTLGIYWVVWALLTIIRGLNYD